MRLVTVAAGSTITSAECAVPVVLGLGENRVPEAAIAPQRAKVATLKARPALEANPRVRCASDIGPRSDVNDAPASTKLQ